MHFIEAEWLTFAEASDILLRFRGTRLTSFLRGRDRPRSGVRHHGIAVPPRDVMTRYASNAFSDQRSARRARLHRAVRAFYDGSPDAFVESPTALTA